jgi:hypothetical protein
MGNYEHLRVLGEGLFEYTIELPGATLEPTEQVVQIADSHRLPPIGRVHGVHGEPIARRS